MKKGRFCALVILIAGLLLVSTSSPAHAEANINFVLGTKFLNEDDWGSADQHGAFGVMTTFGPNDWPVSIAIDAIGSGRHDDILVLPAQPPVTVQLYQATFELDFGVRKIWKPGKARPFVGGGLAIVSAGREFLVGAVSVSESDQSPGVWVNGGAFWRLGKQFNIGVETRLSRAEVRIDGEDIQAGGFNVGLILGWGWGGGS